MKLYTSDHKINKIICNKCGKELKIVKSIVKEDMLSVHKTWGYFSNKDTSVHSFDICETCYDQWTASFVVPPEEEEDTELLGV